MPLPPVVNPTGDPDWGIHTFFPNWTLLIWEDNFYMTYRWPVTAGEHIFEAKLYHMPAKNAEERDRGERNGCYAGGKGCAGHRGLIGHR